MNLNYISVFWQSLTNKEFFLIFFVGFFDVLVLNSLWIRERNDNGIFVQRRSRHASVLEQREDLCESESEVHLQEKQCRWSESSTEGKRIKDNFYFF